MTWNKSYHFKRETWGTVRKHQSKARMKPSKANTKFYSSLSDVMSEGISCLSPLMHHTSLLWGLSAPCL